MSNIERRRNLWYAVLVVPADVRDALGKFKFIQSLGTPDKRKAEVVAAPVLAKWRALIRREGGEGDAVVNEALRWREALALEKDPQAREAIEEQIVDRAEAIVGPRPGDCTRRTTGSFPSANASRLSLSGRLLPLPCTSTRGKRS